jgi:two-component system response regulator HydG
MKILILDDDLTLSQMLKSWLTKKGHDLQTAINVAAAKKELDHFNPDLVISDLRLPDDNGLSFLKWSKQRFPDIAFIMMTSYADIPSAVDSIKSGAFDYVSKPVNPEELLKKIQAAFAAPQKTAPDRPKTKKPEPETFVKSQSPEYQKVYDYVDLVAPTHLSVFIEGESGVGKEHIARMIHEKSKQANGPFVPVDCGVMNKELSASDFFGHVKGSFTGAINNKKGHFEEAEKGTLFLDEIGNLSPEVQMQLLRTLQEKKIKPVGSSKEIDVDVRIVVATNENMELSISTGKFRRDLYHRINEFHIHVPTLKECKADISLFAHHFLQKANAEIDKQVTGFEKDTLRLLQAYHWPGNIRELRNVIFRMTLIAPTDILTKDLLPDNIVITSSVSTI